MGSTLFQNSHSRWRAVTHRAPSSHSSFLYGVKSTKIYCRPTCSARLARRANVVFYDTEDQARLDGYRPCRRCQPDNKTFVGEGEEVVARVIALFRNREDESMIKGGLKELAKEVGVTPSYLCRVFKKTMGVTVGAYKKEFESQESEAETEDSIQSPGKVNLAIMDVQTEFLSLQTTATRTSALVERREERPTDEGVRQVEQSIDLDFDAHGGPRAEDFSDDCFYIFPDYVDPTTNTLNFQAKLDTLL